MEIIDKHLLLVSNISHINKTCRDHKITIDTCIDDICLIQTDTCQCTFESGNLFLKSPFGTCRNDTEISVFTAPNLMLFNSQLIEARFKPNFVSTNSQNLTVKHLPVIDDQMNDILVNANQQTFQLENLKEQTDSNTPFFTSVESKLLYNEKSESGLTKWLLNENLAFVCIFTILIIWQSVITRHIVVIYAMYKIKGVKTQFVIHSPTELTQAATSIDYVKPSNENMSTSYLLVAIIAFCILYKVMKMLLKRNCCLTKTEVNEIETKVVLIIEGQKTSLQIFWQTIPKLPKTIVSNYENFSVKFKTIVPFILYRMDIQQANPMLIIDENMFSIMKAKFISGIVLHRIRKVNPTKIITFGIQKSINDNLVTILPKLENEVDIDIVDKIDIQGIVKPQSPIGKSSTGTQSNSDWSIP